MSAASDEGGPRSLRVTEISLRIKLAVLTVGVVVLVVLGQMFQSLANEALIAQEEIWLESRVMLVSLAAAVGSEWREEGPIRLEPFAERIAKTLDVSALALVGPEGEMIAHVGPAPDATEVDRVVRLRLRTQPRSLWGLTLRPLELLVATPILRGDQVRGHLLCVFTSSEPARRLRAMVASALGWAAFWVCVGGGLALWVAGRVTRPLNQLAADLRAVGREGYRLPEEGRAEGEIGVVQDALVDVSGRLAAERKRVDELNGALQHEVNVVSAQLAAAGAMRQAILDSVRDGIILVSGGGGILSCNASASHMLNTGSTDRPLWELFSDPDATRQAMTKSMRLRGPVMLTSSITSDDSTRPVRLTIVPLSSVEAGTAMSANGAGDLVVVLEDTSLRVRLEEQMRRSERLAAMGTLTAGLAHQIGNHLNAIKGYATLLERRLDMGEQERDDLECIVREVRTAATLMDRVFFLGRTRPPSETPVSVPTVLREVVDVARVAARATHIETDFPAEGCQTRGDPNLLAEAFLNLILNAVQASAGGTVRVSSACRCGDHCVVRIEDDGPGMSPEVLGRVFDPFFTTKPVGEGTGLGLPIAQRIIELHGGEIRVESEVGRGTVFEVDIVVASESRSVADVSLPVGV